MIIAIIQARMGSSRLPGKVLLTLLEKPVLWHVTSRVKKSKYIDTVVVATSDNSLDERICNFCNLNSIFYFAGNENDVLDRFYKTANSFGAKEGDIIVRITADCPLIDPEVIDKVIELFLQSNVDYASNVNPPTFPDGLDVEVFKYVSLCKAWNEAKLSSDREHVTPYIRKNKEIFTQANLVNSEDLSKLRWTLDEKEDFEVIKIVYENFKNNLNFTFIEILDFVRKNSQIIDKNSRFTRNEGYLQSLDNDKDINSD